MNERLFKLLSIVVFGKAPEAPKKFNCMFVDFSDIETRLRSKMIRALSQRTYGSVTGRTSFSEANHIGPV